MHDLIMISLWLLAWQLATSPADTGPVAAASPVSVSEPAWSADPVSAAEVVKSAQSSSVAPSAGSRPLPVFHIDFGRGIDRDLDGQPDGWVRRRGAGFPRYVRCGLDNASGSGEAGSLRIQANGGAAAIYSPLVRIDNLHTYYFEGKMRTEGLRHDAAILSLSLLDHRRRRLQRILSPAVMGDHREWVSVRLGPIVPEGDVHFAVIGCHLALGKGDRHDIGGGAWFDELSLGRLPRLELDSNFFSHFLSEDAPIRVTSRVSGLDPGYAYSLDLSLRNLADAVVAETSHPLQSSTASEPESILWETPRREPGFYRVAAVLKRDGTPLTSQHTTLAVLKLVTEARRKGEFGWSLEHDLPKQLRDELPQIAAQAGVNWLKHPLWRALDEGKTAHDAGQVARLFDRLRAQGIETIGVLDEPPAALRNKFAQQWLGVAEVFRLPPPVWRSSLEPVVARFSSTVHHWQLGSDFDGSFQGIPDLPVTLQTVHEEIRRLSLNAALGLAWASAAPLPTTARPSFWSLTVAPDWAGTLPLGTAPRWLRLAAPDAPNSESRRDAAMYHAVTPSLAEVEQRAGELVRQMVFAKKSGAPAIFIGDIYHPRHGLLKPNGAPAELFLPWRTYALALQGAELLGSLSLPGGSPNTVFARDGEAVMVLWNDQPTTETLYLGEEPRAIDLWGRARPLAAHPATGEHSLAVNSSPSLIAGVSEPIARWSIAAGFEQGKMRSEYGGHLDAIVGRNTFPQGVSGTVSLILPDGWETDAREWSLHAGAGESFRFPVYLTAPATATLGQHRLMLDFRIVADRPYRFRVPCDYTIGLGDVTLEVRDRRLPDGRLEIEQIVTNRTEPEEVLDFRCSLFIPHARRHKMQITKLGRGLDRKYYYLPNADRYRGQTLSLRLEQDGGRRVLNYRWVVGADWPAAPPPAVDRPPAEFDAPMDHQR